MSIQISFTYDWISATVPTFNGFNIAQAVNVGALLQDVESRPQFGYTSSEQYESGARVMWNVERPEMGYHIILSGSTLRWIQEHGQDQIKVLSWIKKLAGRVSRLDCAIDVYGGDFSPETLSKRERKAYSGKGRTPKYTLVGDEEDGWTIYIGSRSSEKFMRIYDKAKESRIEGMNWKRIEIECKGLVAHYLGDILPEKSVGEAYILASTLMRTMVDFKSEDWEFAHSASTVEISVPKRTERDTLGWLIKAAVPALSRLIAEKPSEDVLGLFVEELRRGLRQYNIDLQ